MQYYGTRLSENISRREPEGYLLCLNVPVARTGIQEYLPAELGLTGNGLVPVSRPEEEVFSPETVASFEGMPVTNDHPPDGVDVFNIRALQKGHAHNVRRGSGEESDLLLADLIITDPGLITAILEEGKREISCGYTYELCEENGQYIQRKIRGNHVAVVDAGRAGARVSIRDHKAIEKKGDTHMKKSLSKVLARMAKDGDTETVAEIIEEMIAENPGETGAEEPVTVEVPENREITIDEETLSGLLQRLDQLISLLTAGLAPAEPAADPGGRIRGRLRGAGSRGSEGYAARGADDVPSCPEADVLRRTPQGLRGYRSPDAAHPQSRRRRDLFRPGVRPQTGGSRESRRPRQAHHGCPERELQTVRK